MKKLILVLLVLCMAFIAIAPTVVFASSFFVSKMCYLPGFWNLACLIAYLMDLGVDPLSSGSVILF